MPANPASPVTLRDIADALGVSRTAVSRALRGGPKVGAELRQRVEDTARRLGYHRDELVSGMMSSFARRRAPTHRETLGVLWWEERPALNPGRGDFFQSVRVGLQRAAAARACTLDEILIPKTNPGPRLHRMLRQRGIRGVVLTPPMREDARLDGFPWEEFTCVTIGATWHDPPLHRVQHHYYAGMLRVLEETARRGYTRPVLLMQPKRGLRAYHAAFVEARGDSRLAPTHLDAFLEADLIGWVGRRRPDVVIAESDELLERVRTRWKMPEDMGGVSLDVAKPEGVVSGIFKNTVFTAETAVELLLQARFRGDLGLPTNPLTLMNEGDWVEGGTLRPRVS